MRQLRSWRGPRAVAAAVIAIVVLVVLPASCLTLSSASQADQLATQVAAGTPISDPKDRATFAQGQLRYKTDNQVKVWTGLLQAVGAVVLAVGGYFARRNLGVAQEGQVTSRFTQAIEQLGSMRDAADGTKVPNLEVRLGGIYALERIARDSPRDHWPTMEVLTAYLRENAPWPPRPVAAGLPAPATGPANAGPAPEPATPLAAEAGAPGVPQSPKPRTDVQAALTVLGRRAPPVRFPEPGRRDLSATDLRGASLSGAHLEGAILQDAHLEGAFFWLARLEDAVAAGVDFGQARNLTPEQILSAEGWDALLPEEWPAEERAGVERAWAEGRERAERAESTRPAEAER